MPEKQISCLKNWPSPQKIGFSGMPGNFFWVHFVTKVSLHI
jgi:hypothetical protein